MDLLERQWSGLPARCRRPARRALQQCRAHGAGVWAGASGARGRAGGHGSRQGEGVRGARERGGGAGCRADFRAPGAGFLPRVGARAIAMRPAEPSAHRRVEMAPVAETAARPQVTQLKGKVSRLEEEAREAREERRPAVTPTAMRRLSGRRSAAQTAPRDQESNDASGAGTPPPPPPALPY